MIRKVGFFAALVAAVWLLMIFLMVVFIEGTLWLTGLLHLQHDLGMDTQTTHNYASASGSAPMMIALLGYSGLLVSVWRRINCADPGCPRVGRHPDAAGRHWCDRHHPEHAGEKVTRELLHRLHHEAKRRQ